jgi:transketolase
MKAADALAGEGIHARVIDLYSVKPIDEQTLRDAARATGHLLTVEDHWPEGGIGEAVLSVFGDSDDRPRIAKLAVRELPGSATPEQQLAAAGIDAKHIADAARRLVAGELVGVGGGQEGRK